MITYTSISMLVSPSSKIEWFLQYTFDHNWVFFIHTSFRYFTTLGGTEGSVEISCQKWSNVAWLLVATIALIFCQSASNSVVTKWDQIMQSTCQWHKAIWLWGYIVFRVFICAWSQSVMMTVGQTSGLASLTHWTKKAIFSVVPFDVSIQATRTSN